MKEISNFYFNFQKIWLKLLFSLFFIFNSLFFYAFYKEASLMIPMFLGFIFSIALFLIQRYKEKHLNQLINEYMLNEGYFVKNNQNFVIELIVDEKESKLDLKIIEA